MANWCSLVWIPSTRASASSGVGHGASVFTGVLLAFQDWRCEPLPPLAMWPAFPASDYYGGSAPPRRPQSTADLPATGLAGRRGGQHLGGSHVRAAIG